MRLHSDYSLRLGFHLAATVILFGAFFTRAAYEESAQAQLPDNFESYTPSGAALTSPWSITGHDWLNSILRSSNTHALSGSLSAYSDGTDGRGGVATFGPIVPGKAEIYFYDDMVSPKCQYIAVGDSSGYYGTCVVIRTVGENASTVKSDTHYVLMEALTGTGFVFSVTSIPRSAGWHHALWARNTSQTELWLDGTLISVALNDNFPDFNQFDLGAWNWDSPATGNTGIWYDNARAWRGMFQIEYRWYNDSLTALAVQSEPMNNAAADTTYRLRLGLKNNMNTTTFTNERVALQARQSGTTDWLDLSNAECPLQYASGSGAHGGTIGSNLLTGGGTGNWVKGYMFETASPQTYPLFTGNVTSGNKGEFDFAVSFRNGKYISTAAYEVRAVIVNSSGAYVAELTYYDRYPLISGTTINHWTGAVSTSWATAGNWSPSGAPTATQVAIIPNSAVRDPQLTVNTTIAGMDLDTLRILNLTSNASYHLVVNGIASVKGDISHTVASWFRVNNLEIGATGEYISSGATGGNVEFRGDSAINGIFRQQTAQDTTVTGDIAIVGAPVECSFGELYVTAGNRATVDIPDVTIASNPRIDGEAIFTGNVTLGGYGLSPNMAYLGGTMTVGGNLSKLDGTNGQIGNNTSGSLSVGGDLSWNSGSAFTVRNGCAVEADGLLTVVGAADITVNATSSLLIGGAVNCAQDVIANGTMTAGGNFVSTGADGDITINAGGSLSTGGYVSISDDLLVYGQLNVGGNYTGTGTTSLITVYTGGGALTVGGNVSIQDDLLANGPTSITGNFVSTAADGDITVGTGSSLTIGGTATITDDLTVSGTYQVGDDYTGSGTGAVMIVNNGATASFSGNIWLGDDLTVSGLLESRGATKTLTLNGGANAVVTVNGTGTLDLAHGVSFGAAHLMVRAGANLRLSGLLEITGYFQLLGTGSGYPTTPTAFDTYVKVRASSLSGAPGSYRFRVLSTGSNNVIMDYVQFVGIDTANGGLFINDASNGTERMQYCLFQSPATTGAGSAYIIFGPNVQRNNHWATTSSYYTQYMMFENYPGNAPESIIKRQNTTGRVRIRYYLDGSLLVPPDTTWVGGDAYDDDNDDGNNTDSNETYIQWLNPAVVPTPVTITRIDWGCTSDGLPSTLSVDWESSYNHSGFIVEAIDSDSTRRALHSGILKTRSIPSRGGSLSFDLTAADLTNVESVELIEIAMDGTRTLLDSLALNPKTKSKATTLPVSLTANGQRLEKFVENDPEPEPEPDPEPEPYPEPDPEDPDPVIPPSDPADLPVVVNPNSGKPYPPTSNKDKTKSPLIKLADIVQFAGQGIRIDNPPTGLVRIDSTLIPGLDVALDGALFVGSEEWIVTRRGVRLYPASFDSTGNSVLVWLPELDGDETFDSTGGPLWIGAFDGVDETIGDATLQYDDIRVLTLPPSPGPHNSYRTSVSVSGNNFYWPMPGAVDPVDSFYYVDPDTGNGYLSYYNGSTVPAQYSLTVSETAAGLTPPVLEATVAGITTVDDTSPDHRLEATVNGESLGVASFDGVYRFTIQFPLNDTSLTDGSNAIVLTPRGNPAFGVDLDEQLIDSVVLWHNTTADVPADGLTTALSLSVSGQMDFVIPEPTCRIIDITRDREPVALNVDISALGGGRWRARVSLDAGVHRLAVIPDSAIATLTNPQSVDLAPLSPLPAGAYLAVGPEDAGTLIQPLLDLRAQEKLKSPVFISAESLYDRYGYGVRSAEAIQTAIADLKPGWLLIVGSTLFDPFLRDPVNAPPSFPTDPLDFIPAFQVWTEDAGESPSDLPFADLDDDGLPDIPVGRIPAGTQSQLLNYVNRMVGYAAPAAQKVVAVSDEYDSAHSLDFKAYNAETLAALPLGVASAALSMDDMTADELLAGLDAESADGLSLLAFQGHGGMDIWTKSASPRISSETISRGWLSPVSVVSGTCQTGSFHLWDICMAETLIGSDGQGADILFSPTVFGGAESQREWVRDVVSALTADGTPAAGEVWRDAVISLKSAGASDDSGAVADVIVLFGDPAARVGVKPGTYVPPVVNKPENKDCALSDGRATPVQGLAIVWLMMALAAGAVSRRRRVLDFDSDKNSGTLS
ncbi:MAG: C25 family cysteine peptidase [Planctomycetota bacterium]